MHYRPLGQSPLLVSVMGLGTMTFGEQNSQIQAFEQLDYAIAHGVNFIDTAEIYPIPPREETYGASEEILGRWLLARGGRDQVILASKVMGNSAYNRGLHYIRGGARLSAAHIHQACNDSLARLKTDYIDLYQLHWPDRRTNFFGRLGVSEIDPQEQAVALEESLAALGELIKAGKIRHYGLSNETPWGVMESYRVAERLGLPRPASIQNPYNLLNRTYEIGLSEISLRERLSLLAYSPLAFGLLSGKYCRQEALTNGRLVRYDRFTRYDNENAKAATSAYVDLAYDYGLNPAQMALAFVNQQAFVASNLIGATTMAQLMDNINSISITLQDELLAEIAAIHQRYPNPAP